MADLERTAILRDGGKLMVNLATLTMEGEAELNHLLRRGDTIFVPRARERFIYILGEVHRPGKVMNHHEPAPLTVAEALSLAGGIRSEALLSGVMIMRREPAGPKLYNWNLKAFLRGNGKDGFALFPGDVVYAPPKKGVRFRRGLENIFPFLTQTVQSAAVGATVN